jgi:hypothetical protein
MCGVTLWLDLMREVMIQSAEGADIGIERHLDREYIQQML